MNKYISCFSFSLFRAILLLQIPFNFVNITWQTLLHLLYVGSQWHYTWVLLPPISPCYYCQSGSYCNGMHTSQIYISSISFFLSLKLRIFLFLPLFLAYAQNLVSWATSCKGGFSFIGLHQRHDSIAAEQLVIFNIKGFL